MLHSKPPTMAHRDVTPRPGHSSVDDVTGQCNPGWLSPGLSLRRSRPARRPTVGHAPRTSGGTDAVSCALGAERVVDDLAGGWMLWHLRSNPPRGCCPHPSAPVSPRGTRR